MLLLVTGPVRVGAIVVVGVIVVSVAAVFIGDWVITVPVIWIAAIPVVTSIGVAIRPVSARIHKDVSAVIIRIDRPIRVPRSEIEKRKEEKVRSDNSVMR